MTPNVSSRVAVLISGLALVVALGGTGYAAAKIGGNQIKKNAITSPKVKNDSLTGADVAEASLSPVPRATDATHAGSADQATHATNADTAGTAGTADNATNADHADTATNAINATNAAAVNGIVVSKVDYRSPTPSFFTIYSGGGLTLRASCEVLGADLVLQALTSKTGASIYATWRDLESTTSGSNDLESGSFSTIAAFDLLAGAAPANEDPAMVWFTYDATDGTAITGQLSTDTNAGQIGDSCVVSGTVTRG
jgi:hypothetical protein